MLIKIVINLWDADLIVNKRLTTKIVANKNSLFAMFGETTNMGSWGKIKKKKIYQSPKACIFGISE